METLTQEFLDEVKKDRKKRRMGLIIDLEFQTKFITENDEDKLREELAEEEKKLMRDQKGRIIKDERDVDKIQNLNRLIDKVVSAKQEKLKYEELLKDMERYNVAVIDSPTEDLLGKLDAIAKE